MLGIDESEARQWVSNGTTVRVLPSTLARSLDVDINTIRRWRKDGIPYWSADEVSIKIGLHPVEIWPDYLEVE